MKKVVIGMLLILPLIIVGVVLFTVSFISTNAKITVTDVVFETDYYEVSLSDTDFVIPYNVMPENAQDKAVIWSIENPVPLDPVFVATVGNGDPFSIVTIDPDTGKLNFLSSGSFTVVARAKDGKGKATAQVYVRSDKITKVTASLKLYEMTVGASQRIDLVCEPLDASVTSVKYEATGNSVSIDKNGIVTALREGTADVTVTAIGTDTAASEAVSEAFTVTVKGNGVVGVKSGVNIVNKAILETQILIKDKLPIILEAGNFSNSVTYSLISEAVWESVTPSVASIDVSGRITVISGGKAQFNLILQGNIADSIQIQTVVPISMIQLSKSESIDNKGIAGVTYYANAKYDGGGDLINNSFKVSVFGIEAARTDELIFALDCDAVVATVDTSGLVSLNKDAPEVPEEITLTVTAKYPPYSTVKVVTPYTFKTKLAVAVESFGQIRLAAKDKHIIVLTENCEYDGGGRVDLYTSIYGNGFSLNSESYDKAPKIDSANGGEFTMLRVVASNVTVSNLVISSDTPEKIKESNGLKGSAIIIGGGTRYNTRGVMLFDVNGYKSTRGLPYTERDGTVTPSDYIENVVVEYCTLQNAYYGLATYNAEITLKGSIIRNISNFGITAPSFLTGHDGYERPETYCKSDLVIENCIFSNIVAPAIAVAADTAVPRSGTGNNRVSMQSTLVLKGFIDIYNWQELSNADTLTNRPLTGNESLDNSLRQQIKGVLAQEISENTYSMYRVDIPRTVSGTTVNEMYLNLGIITAGGLAETTTVPDFSGMDDPERFGEIALELPALINKYYPGLGDLLILPPVYIYTTYNNDVIRPLADATESEELYARLRYGVQKEAQE
ncbi:MAG: hypothetical protein LBN25_00645 [Christensenellaceae bacterium]|jgi:hypothetical protein|nr:hypothetical protein [Christensenellaceae bacterium]